MKNVFNGLIRRLGLFTERISEFEVRSMKTSQIKWREKGMKNIMSYGTISKDVAYVLLKY